VCSSDLATGGQPVRQSGGRLPAFGDDDVAPVAGAPQRLADWDGGLRSDVPAVAKNAVAQAVTAGVLFVVLPDRATVGRLTSTVGDLATEVTDASDGRPVVRLQPAGGATVLISPELARRAVTGGQPPAQLGATGISPV